MSDADRDHALAAMSRTMDGFEETGLHVFVGHRVLHEWCDSLLLDDGRVVYVEGYGLIGESGGGFHVWVHPGTEATRRVAGASPADPVDVQRVELAEGMRDAFAHPRWRVPFSHTERRKGAVSLTASVVASRALDPGEAILTVPPEHAPADRFAIAQHQHGYMVVEPTGAVTLPVALAAGEQVNVLGTWTLERPRQDSNLRPRD